MSAHTPGPWILETVDTSSGICHKIGPFPWKNGKVNHACIYVDYAGMGKTERELLANARLIAAAPDMLEALKSLVAFADDWGVNETDYAQYWPILESCRAAIAKAEGGQP